MDIVTLILLLTTIFLSYRGFRDPVFFKKYIFWIDGVLIHKEYIRVISSAFLHNSWWHLGFNMIALTAFSDVIAAGIGPGRLLMIYLVSALGGSALSIVVHKNHGDYSAVGASGAVSGIIFAFIALFPTSHIGPLFFPIGIPGWIFGLLYVIFSIYGIRTNKGNIGHDAHLGGALVGMGLALAFYPQSLAENLWYILAVVVPALVFILLLIKAPKSILVTNTYQPSANSYTLDDEYNARKKDREKELDRLLEKVHRKGMDGLSDDERHRLDELSNP